VCELIKTFKEIKSIVYFAIMKAMKLYWDYAPHLQLTLYIKLKVCYLVNWVWSQNLIKLPIRESSVNFHINYIICLHGHVHLLSEQQCPMPWSSFWHYFQCRLSKFTWFNTNKLVIASCEAYISSFPHL